MYRNLWNILAILHSSMMPSRPSFTSLLQIYYHDYSKRALNQRKKIKHNESLSCVTIAKLVNIVNSSIELIILK